MNYSSLGDNWDANHMHHARAQSMLAIHCLSRLPLSGPSTVRSSQQLSPVRHHGRACGGDTAVSAGITVVTSAQAVAND